MKVILRALIAVWISSTIGIASVVAATSSGTALPATCAIGDTFFLTAFMPAAQFTCVSTTPTVWIYSGTTVAQASQVYAIADNVDVDLFDVALPTANMGCGVHTSYTYAVTDTINTATHTGIAIFAFVNQAGTVTGIATSTGEAIVGMGCAVGCHMWDVNVVSTTATGRVKFNNTLSQTGTLTLRLLNNTCPVTTPLTWK